MQSDFWAITYSNLQHLFQCQPPSQWSCYLHHLECVCIIPDTFYDFRRIPAKVSIHLIKVKFRPMYLLSSLEGLLVYPPWSHCDSSQSFDIHKRRNWRPYKGKVRAASSMAFIYTAIQKCLKVIHFTLW